MRVEEVFALRKWCRVKLLNGLIRQGKSLIQFGFPGSRVSLKDWCSLEATNFLSCSTPSAIECKKSREQRCNEQAIKIFISRGADFKKRRHLWMIFGNSKFQWCFQC
ncbi:uncharacterized protein LOC111920130 isoform X2 [Lactuca sativa]|uniref:uncharacterized protein LOC111920130 isoform X2 n=1 Tax=Lactuca sativa TaxID=4236 RepID=UPI0022AEB8F5|nr:uncharacterized protein LOC111920130 isoform X2 [Lactuca sativa]